MPETVVFELIEITKVPTKCPNYRCFVKLIRFYYRKLISNPYRLYYGYRQRGMNKADFLVGKGLNGVILCRINRLQKGNIYFKI